MASPAGHKKALKIWRKKASDKAAALFPSYTLGIRQAARENCTLLHSVQLAWLLAQNNTAFQSHSTVLGLNALQLSAILQCIILGTSLSSDAFH